MTTKQYWSLKFEPEFRHEDDWLDALEETILEAVKIRLMSDVPLGAFLSGGVDSTVVVLAMSRYLQEPVKTFAIGFDDARFDETSYARRVAEYCGAEHREEVVGSDLDLDTFSKLVAQLDEPMSDPSFVPTFWVSRLARHEVTVVLSGDGGDETFAGYERYFRWLKWQEKWGRIRLGAGVAGIARLLAHRLPAGRRTLFALSLDPIGRFAELSYGFYSLKLDGLYGRDMRRKVERQRTDKETWQRVRDEVEGDEPLTSVQHADLLTYLPDDILMKVDKMSMLNSLEVRVPLLDHRLQELMARMPATMKWRQGVSKYVLKKLLERWGLHPSLVHRKKMGFAPSLGYWFGGGWQDIAYDHLKDGCGVSRELFSRGGINSVRSRRQPLLLWNLWVFETWAREYLGW